MNAKLEPAEENLSFPETHPKTHQQGKRVIRFLGYIVALLFPLADRGVPYPKFKVIDSTSVASGTFRVLPKPPKHRYYGFHPANFGDFPQEELQARPDLMMSSLQPTSLDPGPTGDLIQPGTFHLHDFGTNLSGFLGFRLRAERPATLLVTFDELRTGAKETVDPHRMKCVNCILIELPAGTYTSETIEPYTLRYLQLHALDGAVTLEGNYLRELAHSAAGRLPLICRQRRSFWRGHVNEAWTVWFRILGCGP